MHRPVLMVHAHQVTSDLSKAFTPRRVSFVLNSEEELRAQEASRTDKRTDRQTKKQYPLARGDSQPLSLETHEEPVLLVHCVEHASHLAPGSLLELSHHALQARHAT